MKAIRVKYNGAIQDAKEKIAEAARKNPNHYGSIIAIPESLWEYFTGREREG